MSDENNDPIQHSTQHGGMPPPTNQYIQPTCTRKLITTDGGMVCTVPKFRLRSNNLWIFINGKKEYEGIDYEEVDNQTIKWKKSVPRNCLVEVLIFN